MYSFLFGRQRMNQARKRFSVKISNMAAILRVKRRRDDDPADSFVISTKRLKESINQEGASATDTSSVNNVFKFAGTVDKKVSNVGDNTGS